MWNNFRKLYPCCAFCKNRGTIKIHKRKRTKLQDVCWTRMDNVCCWIPRWLCSGFEPDKER